MPRIVECCIRNIERAERRELDARPDLKLIEKPCLHRCGDCTQGRYTVVDGEFLELDPEQTLLEGVRADR